MRGGEGPAESVVYPMRRQPHAVRMPLVFRPPTDGPSEGAQMPRAWRRVGSVEVKSPPEVTRGDRQQTSE